MSKNSTKTVETTETEIKEVKTIPNFNLDKAVKEHGSISAVFRDLTAKGFTRGQIAKMTGKRYQHVRNVLVAPVKKTEG